MGCELAEEGLSITHRADQWLRIFSLPTENWTQYQHEYRYQILVSISISQRADQWLRIFSLLTEYWTVDTIST